MADLKDIGPRDRQNFLTMMRESPAFAFFCEAFDAKVAALDKKIFDLKTPDAEVRELRLIRAQLVEHHRVFPLSAPVQNPADRLLHLGVLLDGLAHFPADPFAQGLPFRRRLRVWQQ